LPRIAFFFAITFLVNGGSLSYLESEAKLSSNDFFFDLLDLSFFAICKIKFIILLTKITIKKYITNDTFK